MAHEIRFEGKVAIVTGAGNGLGRSHARLLARRGAQVIVNDLGGGSRGAGAGSEAADRVVAEIRDAGGEAAPSYDSVEDGGKIVQAALDHFGRIDIVINNAGILRDTTFHKMTEEDWDLIYRVHVLGSFRVTHAAWPYLREQRYGRVVMTASAAGIYGNFGQANYAMAKLGLTGFANTLALEGVRRNIHVNTIAPLAGSRLTETILPEEITSALKPELVSPLVAWLCHEDCDENGGLYEVGGGFFAKLRWERAAGKMFRLGRDISPDVVRDVWSDITGFEESEHPRDVAASMGPIMANLNAGPSKGGNEFVDVDQALGHEFPETSSSYNEKDLALYALGVGAGSNPLDPAELSLTYENAGDGFKALPTFAVIPAINQVLDMAKQGVTAPGLTYGLDRLLHGEQYTELKRPLPPHATLTHKTRIKDIWDKGKGALIITETKSFDEDGNELMHNELTAFIRGAGGWGGERGPSADVNQPPERDPDVVTEQTVSEGQALLYRLSGDWNPLHADPGFAKAFGFDRPILHGLCTFGYVGRHVIAAFCGGDPRYFRSIKVRFAESVIPGETLVTEMWRESATRIVVRCSVKERAVPVITNAAVELWEEIPKPKAKAAPAEASAPAAATKEIGPADVIADDVFIAMRSFLADRRSMAVKIKTVYRFKLSDPSSVWTIDLKDGGGAVTAGEPVPAGCTLELSDADFLGMCAGKLDAMQLFSSGKLKISGDLMASQKLDFLTKIDPETVLDAARARLGGDASAPASAPDEAATDGSSSAAPEPAAPALFEKLAARLADQPTDTGGPVIQFFVGDGEWFVDLSGSPATVGTGKAADAATILSLGDDDLVSLARGEETTRNLFQRGRLAIAGDLDNAHNLSFLEGLA